MKIEIEILEDGAQRLTFLNKEGKEVASHTNAAGRHFLIMFQEQTLHKLLSFIDEQGAPLSDKDKFDFATQLHDCIRLLSQTHLRGEIIIDQKTLLVLRKAYANLGDIAQRTLLQAFLENAGLQNPERYRFLDPATFFTTIDSFLTGKTAGGGRRENHITLSRYVIINFLWDFYESIGLTPAARGDSVFAGFVRIVFADPCLEGLGGLPVETKTLFNNARKNK